MNKGEKKRSKLNRKCVAETNEKQTSLQGKCMEISKTNKTRRPIFLNIERKFRRAAEKCKFRSASQSTNFASSSTVESPDFSVEFGISLDKDARARMRYYYVKG
jgi:hypothetical protein